MYFETPGVPVTDGGFVDPDQNTDATYTACEQQNLQDLWVHIPPSPRGSTGESAMNIQMASIADLDSVLDDNVDNCGFGFGSVEESHVEEQQHQHQQHQYQQHQYQQQGPSTHKTLSEAAAAASSLNRASWPLLNDLLLPRLHHIAQNPNERALYLSSQLTRLDHHRDPKRARTTKDQPMAYDLPEVAPLPLPLPGEDLLEFAQNNPSIAQQDPSAPYIDPWDFL